MKRLLTTTALGMLLVASPALAQTSDTAPGAAAPQTEQNQPDTSAPSTTPPAMQAPSGTELPGSSGTMTNPSGTSPDTAQTDDPSKPDMAKTDDAAKPDKTASLSEDTLATNLIGVAVENASGETIGEINDILLAQDGSVKSAIVGVGGFLGMGVKKVAIDFAELNIKRDDANNMSVTVAMSGESLEAMPAFKEPGVASNTGTGATSPGGSPTGGSPTGGAPSTGGSAN